jgi:hypothetical protein
MCWLLGCAVEKAVPCPWKGLCGAASRHFGAVVLDGAKGRIDNR